MSAQQAGAVVLMSTTDFDCIFALRSSPQGLPVKDGPDGHFVRISTRPDMPVVDQEHAGGLYPDFDCFDADAESLLAQRGITVPFRTLELAAGTNPADGGTDIYAGGRALREYVPCHVSHDQPPPGLRLYAMNSAIAAVTAEVQPYLDAGIGVMLVIDAPFRDAIPAAPQATVMEDDADMSQIAACARPNGNNLIEAQLGNNGDVWLKELDPAHLDANSQPELLYNVRVGQNGQINNGQGGEGTGLLPSQGIRCFYAGGRLVLFGQTNAAAGYRLWTAFRPDGGENFLVRLA